MPALLESFLPMTLAGALVGFLIGLTGVGGGSMMTPMLVLLFGVPVPTAVGTDLLYAAITKASGVFAHHQQDTVDWKIVRHMAAGSIPATLLTLMVLHLLDQRGEDVGRLLQATMVLMLSGAAITLLFHQRAMRVLHDNLMPYRPVKPWFYLYRAQATILLGVVLGISVTLSSVGAGAVGAALLFLIYPRKPAVTIVGSDIAHAVPLTLLAGLGHLGMGQVDFTLLLSLLAGSLPAIWLGSRVSKRLPEQWLRTGLAWLLLAMAVSMAYDLLRGP